MKKSGGNTEFSYANIMVYHSVLPPCLSTLLAKQISSLLNRHPYILLISLEIFFITCLYPFFIVIKICGSPSPPTHYESRPHLQSRLVILHASELATELLRCRYRDRKAYQCGRITCTLLRNKTKWRLTFSLQQIVIVKALD